VHSGHERQIRPSLAGGRKWLDIQAIERELEQESPILQVIFYYEKKILFAPCFHSLDKI
jgi:hypothetical protein